ncbi:MAG: hypothetical protein AB7O70_08925 [Hyphomicrobiales bacterium]
MSGKAKPAGHGTTFSRLIRTLLLSLALSGLAASPAATEGLGNGKIWPKRTESTVTWPNGERSIAFPLRTYFEYGRSSTKSEPNPLGVVDMDSYRLTAGADFVTSSMWFWGVSFSYLDTEDDGSAPFVPSIATDKEIGGGSVYLGRNITPRLFGGVNAYYNGADGLTVYNGVDRVTESSDFYGFRPFLIYTLVDRNGLEVKVGGNINFNSSDFDYVNNIPPTASLTNVIAHVPLTVSRMIGRDVKLTGFATLNHYLDQETFGNVPAPDETTLTLGGGLDYIFDNGTVLYLRASRDVFDDAYDSTRATVGINIPFSVLFSEVQPGALPPGR